MVERRVTRRLLLEADRQGGAGGALAPIIAACSSGAASARPAAASASASAAASAAASVAPSATLVEPTPVPTPESELFIYNWTDYIGEQTIPSFEKKYGVKVTYDFFSNTDEAYAKLGSDGGGYDVSFPISVDIPAFVAKNALLDAGQVAHPEHREPGRRVGGPEVRPRQRPLDAVHVVDDRRRLRHGQDQGHPTSSKALWDPRWSKHIAMLDD